MKIFSCIRTYSIIYLFKGYTLRNYKAVKCILQYLMVYPTNSEFWNGKTFIKQYNTKVGKFDISEILEITIYYYPYVNNVILNGKDLHIPNIAINIGQPNSLYILVLLSSLTKIVILKHPLLNVNHSIKLR